MPLFIGLMRSDEKTSTGGQDRTTGPERSVALSLRDGEVKRRDHTKGADHGD